MYSYPLHTSICQSLIDVLLYKLEKRDTDLHCSPDPITNDHCPIFFCQLGNMGVELLWTYTNISISTIASFRYQALKQKCQKCQVINSGAQKQIMNQNVQNFDLNQIIQGVPTSLEYVLKLRKVCEQSEHRLLKNVLHSKKLLFSPFLSTAKMKMDFSATFL